MLFSYKFEKLSSYLIRIFLVRRFIKIQRKKRVLKELKKIARESKG
jgi:hypothetical protein